MFAITCAPARARSVAGGPGCQMSSQTVGPISASPILKQEQVAAGLEVAHLVEDPVVGEEALGIDRLDLAVGADGAAVVEVAVEPGEADERRDPGRLGGDLVEAAPRLTEELGTEEEVLGRVARDGELGEEDEVGARVARLVQPADDPLAVAVEVADDGVDLGERESQVFASQSKT